MDCRAEADRTAVGLVTTSATARSEGATGAPSVVLVEKRELVEAGKLQLGVTQYGLTNASIGTSGGQARLSVVVDPAHITGIQADVAVVRADVEACAANVSTTIRARAQIIGGFFNDGSSTAAGDRTGDIIAGIQKIRDTAQGDVIQALIVRCPDFSCSATVTVASQNFATPWRVDQVHTISVLWDQSNKRFIYTASGGSSPETISLAYGQNDSRAPVNDFKPTVPDCNGSRKHATIEFETDRVSIQSAPPRISLALNRDTISPGQDLQVSVTIANEGPATTGDIYFVILLPPASSTALGCPQGDAALFLVDGFTRVVTKCAGTASPSTFPSLASGLVIPRTLSPVTIPQLVSFIWPSIPTGIYTFAIFTTPPGAFADGRIDSGDITAAGIDRVQGL